MRGLTGWQAFREGRALAESGARGFSQKGNRLSGSFGAGRRPLRTTVEVRGESDVEVRCSCAENRSTGAVCAHAVALLLQAGRMDRADPTEPPGQAMEALPSSVPADGADRASARATRVELSGDWRRSLAAGRLALRVSASARALGSAGLAGVAESDRGAGDAPWSAWLAARGIGLPGVLSLSGEDLASALVALEEHPEVVDATGEPVGVATMPPLVLAASERTGGRVELRLEAPADGFPCGHRVGRVSADGSRFGCLPATGSSEWVEQVVGLARDGRLELALDDFLAEVNGWLDVLAVPRPGWLGSLRFRRARPGFELAVEGSLRALDADLRLSYAGGSAFRPGSAEVAGLPSVDDDGGIGIRDQTAERAIVERLHAAGLEAGPRAGELRLRDPDRILDFVANQLPGLQRHGVVRIGERLAHVLRSVHVVRPRVTAGDGGSLATELSFQTDGGKEVPREKVREILRAGRRAVTTRQGATVVVGREIPELVEPLLADLGIVAPGEKLRHDRAAGFLFAKLGEQLSGDPAAAPAMPEVAGLRAELRPYQRDGVAWMFERVTRLGGALLADEMGLGKTLQTLALVTALSQRAGGISCLVLVPASLLANWRVECHRFTPQLELVTLHGAGRDELRDAARGADITLTSYGTLQRDFAFHKGRRYDLLVADEGSLLRNPDSEVSRAVAKLEAEHRLVLTGTPVENRLLDLWSIFRVVAPGYLGSKDDFLARHEPGGEMAGQEAALRERLRLRVSPYVMRRTKREVAPDLPAKLEVDEWLDLEPAQARLHAAIAREGIEGLEEQAGGQGGAAARMQLLTVLLRLRQVCLSPTLLGDDEPGVKEVRLAELLEERAEEGRKTLVFSQFRSYLERLEEVLPDRVGARFRLDGTTRDRGRVVEAFSSAEGAAVFLISLKAGGYGLNLTAADAVVHLDPWWNPAVEAQASDRAHRIGQTRPVTVIRLLARDSVEERVRRLQEHKRAVVDTFGDGPPTAWDANDLRSLLSI